MLDDASSAITLNRSVAPSRYARALADVQLSESSNVVGECLETGVGDSLAAAQRQFFQIRTSGRQCLEGGVADVALPEIQRPQSRAGSGDRDRRAVAERLAPSGVEIPQFVTVPRDDEESGVRDPVALPHGKVSQRRADSGGQFANSEVGDSRTIGYGQLPNARTVGSDRDEARVGYAKASSQIEKG